MLRTHMPELEPIHAELTRLAGGDEVDARMLSLYSPPPFIGGCSQAAWTRGAPALVRNYDYPVSRLEGLLVQTAWGDRRVIGMSDCLWGLLDGLNDRGLAVSLTFGGRRVAGDGFAIPLVVRYLLETCATVDEARAALARIPVHAAQNLTLVDRDGAHVTAFVGPDRGPVFSPATATTNHQGSVEWPEYEAKVHSVARERRLDALLGDDETTFGRFRDAFLEPPLYSRAHALGTGTLYTAVYLPAEGRVELRWPDGVWPHSFGTFDEGERLVEFA
jgi:predicted choloylglycine hydrolase